MTAPNVVLIMADQHKATSLGLYGNPDVRTPGFERLAAQGVQFDYAFTPHPLCVPARASMWTGSYPHNHGIRLNELRVPPDRPTYLQSFQAAGYRTGLVGKNHCFDDETCAGLDTFVEYSHLGVVGTPADSRDAAFRDWIDQPGLFTSLIDSAATPLPPDHCPAARVAEHAEEFIAGSDDRPFLLWVSFPEPHEPYYAPEPFWSRYDPESVQLPPTANDELAGKPERQGIYATMTGLADEPEDRLRRAVAAYYASVSFVDAQVERILAALAATGAAENTIVVYVSDHGDFAGEHGLVAKCNAFYDCLTRVPLLLAWPGHVPAGTVVADLVSTIDVMPTLAALTGVSPPPGSRGRILPGVGLPTQARTEVFAEYGAGQAPLTTTVSRDDLLAGTVDWRQYLRAREAEGRAKMIRTAEWKHVFDPLAPDAEELYDLRADPHELVNLAPSDAHRDVVDDLRSRLLAWSLATEDATTVPFHFDPETLRSVDEPHASPLSG